MKKLFALISFVAIAYCFLLPPFDGTNCFAQCAMCKAVVESNMQGNSNAVGTGLNTGILYLMAMPYIIALTGLFFWYRSGKLSARKQIQ